MREHPPVLVAAFWRVLRCAIPSLVVGLLPCLAVAQQDGRQVIENPDYSAWAKFPPGTTAVFLINNKQMTVKIVSVAKSAVQIDRQGGDATLSGLLYPAGRHTVPSKLVITAGALDGPWEDKGEETLKVGERSILCKVQRLEKHSGNGGGGMASHRVSTRWLSDEVPGRLVKENTRRWGNIGVKGTELDLVTDVTLTGFQVAEAAAAVPPVLSLTDQEIDALIQQLGADGAKDREQAQAMLLTVGERALSRLTAVIGTLPPEAQTRATTIVRELERRAPTRITLKLKGVSARDAFAELSRLAGVEFRTDPMDLWKRAANRQVSIDAVAEPLWAVLKKLETQTGIRLAVADGMMRAAPVLTLTDWPERFPASAVDVTGQYLFVLHANDPSRGTARLDMSVLPEPRLWTLRRTFVPAVDDAVDDKGSVLILASNRIYAQHMTDFPPVGSARGISFELAGFDPAAKRIAKLHGTFQVELLEDVRETKFTDILKAENVTKTLDGRRLTVKAVDATRAADGLYSVIVTVYRDRRGQYPRELGVAWSEMAPSFPRERLILQDAKGRALLPAETNGQQLTSVAINRKLGNPLPDDSADFRFTYSRADHGQPQGPPDVPATLVWSVGTGDVRQVAVPMRFDFQPLAPAAPAAAAKPITRFSFTYNFPPSPGRRVWVKTDADSWEEHYADGQVTKFKVRRRLNEADLQGTVVSGSPESKFEVYIPDRGVGDWVRFRHGPDKPWSYLGKIESSE